MLRPHQPGFCPCRGEGLCLAREGEQPGAALICVFAFLRAGLVFSKQLPLGRGGDGVSCVGGWASTEGM